MIGQHLEERPEPGGFLGAILGLFAILQCVSRLRTQVALACALALLLVLDVRTSAPDLQPTVAHSVLTPDLIREHGQFGPLLRHGQSRAMISAKALQRMRYTSVTRWSDDLLGRRVSLQGNCNLMDDIPKLNGFYSMYLGESDRLLRWMESNPVPEPLLDFLNVSHVSETNGTSAGICGQPSSRLPRRDRSRFLPILRQR